MLTAGKGMRDSEELMPSRRETSNSIRGGDCAICGYERVEPGFRVVRRLILDPGPSNPCYPETPVDELVVEERMETCPWRACGAGHLNR